MIFFFYLKGFLKEGTCPVKCFSQNDTYFFFFLKGFIILKIIYIYIFLNLKGFLLEGTCFMWILLRVHSFPWQSFSLVFLFLFFTFNSVCEPFFLWWSNLSQAHVFFLWLSNIFLDFWLLSLCLVLLLAISCSSFFFSTNTRTCQQWSIMVHCIMTMTLMARTHR